MTELKEDIAAERDALRAENDNLRGQLAAAGASRPGRAAAPEHRFELSEGDRQELEIRGGINYRGRWMTTADVEAAMAKSGQQGVEIADAPEATRVSDPRPDGSRGPGREGLDYIWPSVERGQIDPAVAGTPGITGPAADETPAAESPVDPDGDVVNGER